MKFVKSGLLPVAILCALISLQACKAKKLPPKPAQPTASTPPPAQQPAPQPVQQAQVAPPPAPAPKPDYSFNNIQFEFNSSVLKTASYPVLDHVASEIKMDPAVKFDLNGYASHEGTPQHNMILSEDRANSVKTYLLNMGISNTQLTAEGFGIKNPIADNSTEEGRVLNRRVEIHKIQ